MYANCITDRTIDRCSLAALPQTVSPSLMSLMSTIINSWLHLIIIINKTDTDIIT